MEERAMDFIRGLHELPTERVAHWLLKITFELDRLGVLNDVDRARTFQFAEQTAVTRKHKAVHIA